MSFFDNFWDNILHIDKTFDVLVDAAPILSYIILFLVIFAETAFIVTAFLPSDVVLFTACSYVAKSNKSVYHYPYVFCCSIVRG